MHSFSNFIAEASIPGKNTHMTHVEDQVISGGVEGTAQALNALESIRNGLEGHASNHVDISVKWDGAPAVFAGQDPTDGKFFVAKKGIFNKNPVVYKSVQDVKNDTNGDLQTKLVIAFKELSRLGIQGIVQGDIMFTSDTLKTETIDSVKYVTFHPNTIVYAVEASSDIGRQIKKARIGVVFHTTYTGRSFESLVASYGVDVTRFKKTDRVWVHDAMIRDLSGTATLTGPELKEVDRSISTCREIFSRISKTTLAELEKNPEVGRLIDTFNNTLVRAGSEIGDPEEHVSNLIEWIRSRFEREALSRKSEKGQAAVTAHLLEILEFFSKKNAKNLTLMFELMNGIVHAKKLLIGKLETLNSIGTFLKTKDGFQVTGQEGFVAIDHLMGGALKIVDRLQFSHANFSPDVVKGWEH